MLSSDRRASDPLVIAGGVGFAVILAVSLIAVPFSGDLFNHVYRVDLFSQAFKVCLALGFFLIVCLCLAISAFYELIEWWVALLSEEAADSFLGTQGYTWDTQSDMAWALFGCAVALFALSAWHDRQLRQAGYVGSP